MNTSYQLVIRLEVLTAAAVICNGFFWWRKFTQIICTQTIERLIEHNCVLGDIFIRGTTKVHQLFPDQLCAWRFVTFLWCHFNVKCTRIDRLPRLTHRAFNERAGKLSRVFDNLTDILVNQRIRIIFLLEAAFIIGFVFDGGYNVNIQLASIVSHDNIFEVPHDALVKQVVKIAIIIRLILAHGIIMNLRVDILC